MAKQTNIDFIDANFCRCGGFDEAIIGIVSRADKADRLCYDRGKCMQILTQRDKLTFDEAECYINTYIMKDIFDVVVLTRFPSESYLSNTIEEN